MLTRSGLGATIAALVLVVCGWWWRYEELVVVAVSIVALVLVALWSARAAVRTTVTRRVAAPRVARGDPIRAVYRVVNPTRRRVPPVTVIDRCGDARVTVPVAGVDADDRTESVGLIPTSRRGVFTLGPLAIEGWTRSVWPSADGSVRRRAP